MNLFPRRDDIEELKDNSTEIIYQITDWFIPETDKNNKKEEEETPEKYSIYIYGTNDKGITICTKVINFKPYFYVKVPKEWEDLNEKAFKNKVADFELKLRNDKYESSYKTNTYNRRIISPKYLSHFDKIEILNKKDFWGFTNNKEFRFLKITCHSLALFNSLKYYFQNNDVMKQGFKLYESNIDPFLKFIHIRGIKPVGWIKVSDYSIDDDEIPDTTCNYNITADWKDIHPMNDINTTAPFIIASFDIECTSSHGDFPVAIKNYKKLAQDLCYLSKCNLDNQNLISYICDAYTDDVIINNQTKIHKLYPKNEIKINQIKETLKLHEPTIRFILSKVKTVDKNESENDNENESENEEEENETQKKMTNKEYNEIEEALNLKLTEILPPLEGDKIIQIGITVNKYGSDDIIYKKILSLNTCDEIENTDVVSCKTEGELLMAWKRFMTTLNPDIIVGYNIWGFDIEYIWNRTKELGINGKFKIGLGRIRNRSSALIEQKLSSSALGDNTFKLFDLDGIVCIDLFKVIQKDFKLDSYKLDNVASIYIGEKKDDLKPNEIFEKFKGGSADRCIIAKYCIQDCILVNKLLHKLKIIENNIGMGNVCLVPLNYLFRRGQGIKIFSLVSNECMKKNYLIPARKNVIVDDDTEGYEGAIVLEPKEAIYLDEPIVVFDYGSLYPSSMICRNLSHDTFIIDKSYMDIKDDNIEIIKVSYDLYEGTGDKKTKTGVQDCYYATYKDGKKGVIPDILDMLLTARKDTRKKIEYVSITLTNGEVKTGFPEEYDDYISLTDVDLNKKTKVMKADIKTKTNTYSKFECAVFDALQNAYKITANSLYGQIGARTSPIYLKEIAACTTSTGREMIMLAKNFVETNYNADVIYGDTDSIFCKFKLLNENGEQVFGKEALPYAIKTGIEVETKIKKHLPYPQKLNYEKSMYPFILFSKKRYVGNLYEKDVNSYKQKSMGIVLKRRDNANIVKQIYGGIIDIILNQQDLEGSIKFLREELRDLVEGKTDMKSLILSKTLRGYYKDPTKIAHKVLADRIALRDPGNKPAVNDRIQYIYIKNKEAKLQGDKIETPEFIHENNLEPDYLHYITNQIMKPILQLYVLCLDELNDYNEESNYWDTIEEGLKIKKMYEDDKRRKNRIENLKLLKVKELLFDEFINKLKEPVIKKSRTKKEPKKEQEKEPKKEPKKEQEKEEKNERKPEKEQVYVGDIRIIESKANKSISYKMVIKKGKEDIYEKKDENITSKTKEEILKELLIELHDNYKGNVIKLKINYKQFTKFYNTLKAKYEEFLKGDNNAKLHKEISKDIKLLETKDTIIIEE
jgi:DNA polymerase elongation subunit (family B)